MRDVSDIFTALPRHHERALERGAAIFDKRAAYFFPSSSALYIRLHARQRGGGRKMSSTRGIRTSAREESARSYLEIDDAIMADVERAEDEVRVRRHV